MQKKHRHSPLHCLFLAPVVALATVTLRTISLLTKLDAESGFYTSPTLAIISAGILISAMIAMGVFSYKMRARLVFRRDYRDLPTLFSGSFLAVALVFFGVTALLNLPTELPLLLVSLLPILSAFGGAALFAVHAFDGSAEGSTKAMLTLPLAAFGVFYALYLSMENTVLLNAPVKLTAMTAWIFSTFFFLGEARIALSRAKWPFHIFSTVITVIFTATLSIPDLVYQAAVGSSLLGNTAHDFVALGVCLYALASLCTTVTAAIRKEAPDTAAVTCANERSDEEATDEEATDR